MNGMGIPARTPGITHHSKLLFRASLIWRSCSTRALDVTLVGLLLDEGGHGLCCCLFVSEGFRFRLSDGTDAAPAGGHGVARLGYLPELAGVARDELKVARFGCGSC